MVQKIVLVALAAGAFSGLGAGVAGADANPLVLPDGSPTWSQAPGTYYPDLDGDGPEQGHFQPCVGGCAQPGVLLPLLN